MDFVTVRMALGGLLLLCLRPENGPSPGLGSKDVKILNNESERLLIFASFLCPTF